MPKHEHSDELDDIFAPLIDSPSLTLTSIYWEGAKQAIQDWHTRQLQDFAKRVEGEVLGQDVRGCDMHDKPSDFCSSGSCLAASAVNDEKSVERQALNKLLKELTE